MLNAEHRLRAADDFRTTVRRGFRAGRPLVVVHAIAAPEVDEAGDNVTDSPTIRPPRVGFVVSRAVGSAVERNAVKRRLRHLMRERIDMLPSGARVVIRARPEAVYATSAALGRDLDSALARLHDRMAA